MGATARAWSADALSADMPASRIALFEARLEGRDVLPPGKARAFAGLDTPALERARTNTTQVAQRIRIEVRLGRAQGRTMAAILGALAPDLFSPDHGWRDIFAGLARQGPVAEGCRRVAVDRYLDYLSARLRYLDQLLAND